MFASWLRRGARPDFWRCCSSSSSVTISCAFQTLITPLWISRSSTSSKTSFGAPAAVTTLRACSVMWPFWMPSVASARMAAKFCASPTAPMTCASSVAESTPSSRKFSATVGFDSIGAPTMPTLIGSSMRPQRLPCSSAHQSVSDE